MKREGISYAAIINNIMGCSESQIDQYFQMSGDMSVTKTQGKKSVGGINRMVMDAQYFDKKLEKACKDNRFYPIYRY